MPQRKHGVTRHFACRARVVRLSFPFFFNNRTRRGEGKTNKDKNPNLKRCVLRESLAPKISFLSLLLSVSLSHADLLCLFCFPVLLFLLLLPNIPLHILQFFPFAPLGNGRCKPMHGSRQPGIQFFLACSCVYLNIG